MRLNVSCVAYQISDLIQRWLRLFFFNSKIGDDKLQNFNDIVYVKGYHKVGSQPLPIA